jgi:glutamate racemase
MLQRYLAPVRESGADVLGLGCTHYPFLRHQIRRLLGPEVRVYDSAEPVARRVQALLAERDALAGDPAQPGCEFYTTGEPQQLYRATRRFLRLPAHEVHHVDLDGAGHAVSVAGECSLPATMVSA